MEVGVSHITILPCNTQDVLLSSNSATYVVVDSNQSSCYNDKGGSITCGRKKYPGQDADYSRNPPSYTDNGDGTVTDDNTGLMWSATTINDVTFDDGPSVASSQTLGGYSDWRVPSVKEMYSLMDFNGETGTSEEKAVPYLDSNYFDMEYYSSGDRHIDAQYLTSTAYVATVMGGTSCYFGVNFADGRIKCYPQAKAAGYNLRVVRGAETFVNSFVDNNDDTITDSATDLMWMKKDSGSYASEAGTIGDGRVDWQEALNFCNDLTLAGHSDWHLPNAKELQSLVDYTR